MASANVIELNQESFERDIVSDLPVLVDFWAPWCGPCRMLLPIIDEIADENVGRYKVCKVNIDENPSLVEKYKVLTIPTVYAFHGGRAQEFLVGVQAKTDLLAMLTRTCVPGKKQA